MEKFNKSDIWNNEKPEELPDICLEKRKQDRSKRMLRIDPNTYVLVHRNNIILSMQRF